LGGACDKEFHAETFDQIPELSKQYATDMFKEEGVDHLAAIQKMQELMKNPEAMNQWFDDKRKQFETLSNR
jgi:hypothetical protein